MPQHDKPTSNIPGSECEVGAVGRRYGIAVEEVREVAGGVANRGFVLGEELFLRVARPGFEEDLRKEAGVVPVARAAGVLTPAIVEYDDSRELIDAPYVVMERIHGSEPAGVPVGLAAQLARLHRVDPTHIPGTLQGEPTDIAGVPRDDRGDPWRTVDGLAERGYLDAGTAKWLSGWFSRLADRFDRDEPNVLIHGDVAAHNLLAGPDGELRALIDWGDAAWAPRGMDFAQLPLEHVAAILPTYIHAADSHDPPENAAGSHAGREDAAGSHAARDDAAGFHAARDDAARRRRPREEEVAAAAVWFHLDWGLGKLAADPWPGQRHWTAPPASRVLGLLRFFAAGPPAPWSTLT